MSDLYCEDHIFDALPQKTHRVFAAVVSVAKWHPCNPERGEGKCGWCLYCDYHNLDCNCGSEYSECSVGRADVCCDWSSSLYQDAFNDRDGVATENLYFLLKDTYEEEYAAFMKGKP